MVPFELLRLTFPDLAALEREVAANIRYGRVFVGHVLDAPVLTEGDLVIVHPVHGRELRLPAQIVMVNYTGAMRGTGLALRAFGPSEVERVQAFARELGPGGAGSPVEEPRARQQTPQPRPRQPTPMAIPTANAEPRPRQPTPMAMPITRGEPRPRQPTPMAMPITRGEPRPRQPTPMAMPITRGEPRPRQPTPTAMPINQPETRNRQATPVPLPATLSDRPRRGTPDPRSEAVTVRPSTGPIAGGTVPPTAPENDWSDLHSSEFSRPQPAAPRSEIPAALRSEAPPAAPTPTPVATRADPPPPATADDDWSDFADPQAEARASDLAQPAAEMPAKEAAAAAIQAQPASEGEETPLAPAADGGVAEPAQLVAQEPLADDDWSDVAAAIAEPKAAKAVAVQPPMATEDEVAPADAVDRQASDFDAASDEIDSDAEDVNADPAAPQPTELQSDNRQQRLRALNAVEQLKVARRGELSDRIVIERLYGKQVWEALLQNPRITLPEVARIARKGTVPRPLIDQILENAMWIKEPNVRRALLSNPKLTTDGILKLLRMMPKHELKIMEKATAFPMSVRDVARKLLREGAQ